MVQLQKKQEKECGRSINVGFEIIIRSISDQGEGLGASVGLEGAVIQGWASTSSINGRLAMSLVNIQRVNPIESISMNSKIKVSTSQDENHKTK